MDEVWKAIEAIGSLLVGIAAVIAAGTFGMAAGVFGYLSGGRK